MYAPFEGTVVAARDGWPDRRQLNLVRDALRTFLPGGKITPDDLRPATGNYLIVEGPAGAAPLAHLRRGSLAVATGEHVHLGQPLAEVGNSGRSLAPHLHFQLMDGPDPLRARIIPFKVRRFERWDGSAWQPVTEGWLGKGERLRVPG